MKFVIRLNPLIIFVSLVVCISIACGTSTTTNLSASNNSTNQQENKSSNTNNFTATPKPTNTPEPTNTPTATPNPNLIPSGTHLIGTEMRPGLYKGQEEGCYWERLKDLSGSFDAIIANGNADGQFYVSINETDAAFTSSCSVLLLNPLPEPALEFPQVITQGMYLVGIDIKPGIYFSKEEGCYWERLKDLSGDFNGIISNGNSYGQFYVKLKENDYAFSISCEATLLETIEPLSTAYPESLNPGMYLIGRDIEPGRYKGNEEGCYWERLSDVTGGFDSIIANGNSDGQFYIQVSENDYGLSTSCEVVKVNE